MTARRDSRQEPRPLAGGLTPDGPAADGPAADCARPVPRHSPSHSALERSTQRSSPVPGRSARSRERRVKNS